MRIKLFLRTIYQEYPDYSQKHFGNHRELGDVPSDWPMEYWQYRYSRYEKSLSSHYPQKIKLNHIKMRREIFGGLIFDPSTTAVFITDNEAFNLISLLQKDIDINAYRKQNNISRRKIFNFIQKLKLLDLW